MDAADELPSPNKRMRSATVLTGVALGALAVSAALFTLPVTNPGVQSCGAPAVFLLEATSDRPLVESDGTYINGWDAKEDRVEIRKAQKNPCSTRVARRAVPAGILLVVFWVLVLIAAIIGWTGRWALRKRLQNDTDSTP